MTLSAPGTEAFKQDFAKWEDLRGQATQVLDRAESSLSKKLQAKQSHDRLAAGVDDKAPAATRQQVDDYFKALAAARSPDDTRPAGHDAFRVSAAVVAGARRRGAPSRPRCLSNTAARCRR